MPTIDELPQANSVSDSDEIMVSQSDIARKATRAQILSGVQSALALPQNSLLGRISPGTGAPETIAIGANISLANGSISAPPAFVISELPNAGPPQPEDLVAISQGGQNAAESYSAFMGGLGGLSGIVGSSLLASATGGVGARALADIFSDAISIESFGALGDGINDDTEAFQAAAAAGRAIRLDSRVYLVNGPILLHEDIVWLGIAGGTVVRRNQVVSQSPWIEFAGSTFNASGIIFDGNDLAAANWPLVQVDETCVASNIVKCKFINSTGSSLGNGLVINSLPGSDHQISACEFTNNQMNGLLVSGSGAATVRDCVAKNNGASGVCILAGLSCKITNNICNQNDIGIAVGAWQLGAGTVASEGYCMIDANLCVGNASWGIAVGYFSASVQNNVIQSNGMVGNGGGIVARLGRSRLAENQISGGGVAIDARTSWGSQLMSNHISGTTTGMLLGGCQDVVVASNFIVNNQWAMDITAIEPTLSFAISGPVSIERNWIGFTLSSGGGIFVHDGCPGISVIDNDLNGWGSASVNQALWLHADSAIVRGNTWNNQSVTAIDSIIIGSSSTLVFPDIADTVYIDNAINPIYSLLTCHQADTLGQICFIKITDGGTGYTSAQVAISGSGGGASADAIVYNGSVLWIVVVNPGSGYGPIGSTATVTITGDGTGATAIAYVGLPVLSGRQLRLSCNCTLQLAFGGASPPQQNWTNYLVTVPALGSIEIEGMQGAWRAVSFPSIDYLYPTGDGGSVLQSANGGSIKLRPDAGGALQLASSLEPSGCTSSVGRGAPTGIVAAPPGSDYRNLNGGAGNTLWIKQIGIDASGWIAVA